MAFKIETEKFYKTHELSKEMEVTEETIRRWCRSKKLQSKVKGREYYILGQWVYEFIMNDDRDDINKK